MKNGKGLLKVLLAAIMVFTAFVVSKTTNVAAETTTNSTVTYYANGGTENPTHGWADGFTMNPADLDYLTLPADSFIAPAGKEFDYWLANDMSLTHYAAAQTLPNDNSVTALTAMWKDTTDATTTTAATTITYYANGGTVDQFEDGFEIDPVILGYKTLPADAYIAPKGYVFGGWVGNDPNLTVYGAESDLDPTNYPTALSAIWTEITYHDITYHSNQIDGKDSSVTIKADLIASDSTFLNVASNLNTDNSSLFTPVAGNTFLHWNTKADDSGMKYAASESESNPVKMNPSDYPTDLYAIYNGKITYYANGGSVNSTHNWPDGFEMDPSILDYMTLPADSYDPPAGKEFDYWVANDISMTQYAAGATMDKNNLPTALAAVWKDKPSAATATPADSDNTWCVTFLDCKGNTVSVQWVAQGASAVVPSGFGTYTNYSNVTSHRDLKPTSCSVNSSWVVPNTADRGID